MAGSDLFLPDSMLQGGEGSPSTEMVVGMGPAS